MAKTQCYLDDLNVQDISRWKQKKKNGLGGSAILMLLSSLGVVFKSLIATFFPHGQLRVTVVSNLFAL